MHNRHEPKIDWLLKVLFVNLNGTFTKTQGCESNDFSEGQHFHDNGVKSNLLLKRFTEIYSIEVNLRILLN